MRRSPVILSRLSWGLVGLALAISAAAPAGDVRAQPPRFAPPTLANVCSTPWGWCPLYPPGNHVVGYPCRCFTERGEPVSGRMHAFDYSHLPNVSPYLNPHAGPPPTR